MNIVVLCLSPGHGGLELYALREIEELNQRGHACIPVVTPDSMLASQLKDSSNDYHTLTTLVQVLPLLAAYRLARLLELKNIDVLHIHWARDLNLAVLAMRLTKRRIKLVYSRHMGITRSKRDLFHRWFYTSIDLFICNSRMVEGQAYRFLPLPAERISRLYIGVTEPDLKQKNCAVFFENRGFCQRKLNLVLFGRIEHGKGQHLLVAAMQHLVQTGLDVSATLIGHIMDQDYYDKLLAEIENSELGGHIQFMGFVTQPANQMACFDLLVLTTYCETFGLVLVEAMRAGVAVIGTDAGGVPEIIEHEKTGLLIPPGNSAALAGELSRIYNDAGLRKQFAREGKNRADREFNAELHFNQLEKKLEHLRNRS